MTTMPPALPELRARIHFDTLLAQALQAIENYAGKRWTDTAEHDPGITLLQALCYATSDVAYRHTLPLVDLLTPESKEGQDGIFPAAFGPHQALTCGPITEDDYRRAILDLHSSDESDATLDDEGTFFFRNVQLRRETKDEQSSYFYNAKSREFVFQNEEGNSALQPLSVSGTYRLYLERNRDVTQADAESKLDEFLADNRNLCEHIRTKIWLDAAPVDLYIVVELDDDCTEPARIMAEIFQRTEALIRPQALRYRAAELAAQGFDNESIYQGPRLTHGWIPTLPAALDYASPQLLNISRLAHDFIAIDGVKTIQHLSFDATEVKWEIAVPQDASLSPWGENPFDKLALGGVVKLLKRGQQLSVTADEIRTEIPKPELIDEPDIVLDFGRWRKPGRYYYASQRLPPCYGLLEEARTFEQKQLHQFLLPFEQQLANSCDQLARLPELLSFQRAKDTLVWGGQWPLPEESVAQKVHAGYVDNLKTCNHDAQKDADKELAIVDYLLSYFGSGRSARTLWLEPSDDATVFLQVQKKFLSQHSELAYSRASLRVDEVSALQRRIAARLGLGKQMFDDPEKIENLPFYIVEHRALLPVEPNTAYNGNQTLSEVKMESLGSSKLLITVEQGIPGLKVGQLIDLVILDDKDQYELVISSIMIAAINGHQFTLDSKDHTQLASRLSQVLDAFEKNKLRWKNCNVWLNDMLYDLAYADDPLDVVTDQKQLISNPFPIMLGVNNKISIQEKISSKKKKLAVEEPIVAQVVSVDPVQGSFIVRPIEGGKLPDNPSKHQWYITHESIEDRFSFVVSVVFNRKLLEENVVIEPAVKAAWFAQVVREEMPAHVFTQVHWMADFDKFANAYKEWQNDGATLGDMAYKLLNMLSLGQLPGAAEGINAAAIADEDQKKEVVGAEGNEWNTDKIEEHGLFYIPPNAS